MPPIIKPKPVIAPIKNSKVNSINILTDFFFENIKHMNGIKRHPRI